jgi:hypothetical protein
MIMTAKTKEKEAKYNLIVRKAKKIESIRRRLRSDLMELDKMISKWEQEYGSFRGESEDTRTEMYERSAVGSPFLPMTRETRVGTMVLVAEYANLRINKIAGEYILWSKYWSPSS